MKKYLTKITKLTVILLLGCLLPFCAFAQVTATISFENLSPAAFGSTPYTRAFSSQTGGLNFLATGRFKMQGGGAGPTYYGANQSPYFMDSGDDTGPAVNSANIGGFTIQNSATAFKVNSFAAYTASDKSGNTKVTSNVTFIGTKADNTIVTGVVTITPTNTGSNVQNGLTLAGTALNNVYFTKLEVSLPLGTQYLELDDINVTTQAVTTNQLSINDVSLTEGNSGTKNFTFTVTRTDNTTASSVQVQSSNNTATAGSDYVAFPLTTLNFTTGGALTQTVNVIVNGDATIEPDETFTMTLSNASSGSVLLDATGMGTILDDDAIREDFEGETQGGTTFSQSGFNFTSTGGQFVRQGSGFGSGGSAGYLSNNAPGNTGNVGGFQITNTGTSFNVLSVDLWTANTSGTAPNYVYTPATASVTITGTKADGTGTVAVTVSVATTGNPFVVVDLTGTAFNGVQLTALSFSLAGATFLEIDNFRFGTAVVSNTQLSINDVSVLEGTGGGVTTVTFTVTRTNNTTAFTVNVASSNGTATAGSDYTAFPSTTLTFTNGGALSQTVSVNIIRDASIETNETFNMTLSGATNGTLYFKQVGIGTILDDDQVIETFEDETNNATTFSQNLIAFTATGGYKVVGITGGTLGAGSSGFYLTSANNVVGSMGMFSISTPSTAFKINSLDAWVGTSQAAFSSGIVTFTGTLFGGGTISTNKTITATSNTGAGWQQNISFTGTPLNNLLLTAIQVTTTGALKACDIDNFNYVAVGTLPIIEVTDASNNAITNNGTASAVNNTAFGATCVTGGIVSKTYTIKNTGVAGPLTLSGSPLAVVGGTDASQFSITTQPTSPIAAGGSVMFTIAFNPTTAGTKNATITLNSNDPTNSPYVINVSGVGNADPTISLGTVPSICAGATSFTIPYTATTNSPVTYSISGGGFTTVTDAFLPATPITLVLTAAAAFGTDPTYNLTVKNANGCISTIAAGTITVNANTLPATAQTVTQSVVNNSISASGCAILVNVLPNGGAAVTGNVTAKVWVETTQPVEFVKRHYEINPATNAANATARVTLYFSDAEFNSFNTQTQAPALLLPISTDAPATITARKANIRIEKRAGTGDANGALSSYLGPITTIDPADADIIWNASASRWEVIFNVAGFSGFWLKTTTGVLPLNLLSFTGVNTNNGNFLQWKTSSEINTKTFEIERQLAGTSSLWVTIASQPAVGIGANNYSYTDVDKMSGTVYYRLKMIDNDGRFTYSNIIKISNQQINQSTIYPNPIKDKATLQIGDRKLISTYATITDANGRKIKTILIKNDFEIVSMSGYSSGLYILRMANGETLKLIKE